MVEVQYVDEAGFFYVHDLAVTAATRKQLMEDLHAHYSTLGLVEEGPDLHTYYLCAF